MKSLLVMIVAAVLVGAACGSEAGSEGLERTATLVVTALAGPTCPVETDPPTPGCEPRPVDGATIVVNDGTGSEVARAVTGPDGVAVIAVPPGDLVAVPQPVEGLLGTAGAIEVTIADGGTLEVTADYDTGIR